MFGTLIGRKRITEEKLATVMVNRTMRICDELFPEFVDYLSECPHFDSTPDLPESADVDFILTVFTCNITRIPLALDGGQDKRVAFQILKQLAQGLDMDYRALAQRVQSTKSLMKKLNHPSKNLIYAMPKALFELFGLNDYQQTYFKDLKSPNPLFLKEMNQMFEHLVWDWDLVKDEYKIVQ